MRWASLPIELGPGSSVRPLVLGPGDIPKLTDPEEALESPELAVLSVRAHAEGPEGAQVYEAAVQAFAALGVEKGSYYYDLAMARMSEAVRLRLEKMMHAKKFEGFSEWARGHYRRGEEKGREEGKEEGKEEGVELGLAQAILMVLSARGLPVSEEVKAKILACRDKAQLEAWLEAAATAESIEAALS